MLLPIVVLTNPIEASARARLDALIVRAMLPAGVEPASVRSWRCCAATRPSTLINPAVWPARRPNPHARAARP
jgi:hypothetical protein